MKIIIGKLVGDLGEQWSIEVPIGNDVLHCKDPVNAVKAISGIALRVVDDRLLEMNMRLLDSNRMAQSLTPDALLALRQTVEIMYGRRVAPDGPGPQSVGKPVPEPPTDASVAKSLEKALEAVDEGSR